MSFFTYYGKLKDELFVAILPKGTVEVDDPIHFYSQKQFMSYRARNVTVTDDGEDRITFQDGYYIFEAVTSKSYRSINLIRKSISGGQADTVALTRHYDQPQTATPLTPKIWTGAINFHEWASNESLIVIAPKGLGDARPIVALWQWSKDAKGTPKTLSYGVSKQSLDGTSHEKFSFQQNEYYTLVCHVNSVTKGLQVTVKAPTNADKVQKELALAPTNELGAEHRFTPPRARQEKVTLECSLPNAMPSLPRVTAALPFPADLIETLSYSAAYVDQAGYLAKYAVKQFEKLDKSYHLLEKKSEARATKIINLEGDVRRLTSESQGLTKRNADLENQAIENRRGTAQREAALEERLRKALAALRTSENKVKSLEKRNAEQKAYIAKDKIDGMERERKNKEDDEADHAAIDLANEALVEAREFGNQLVEKLEEKTRAISALKSDLGAIRDQMGHATAEIGRLGREVEAEKKEKLHIQTQLDETNHKLTEAEKNLKHAIKQAKHDLAEEKLNTEFLLKQKDDDIKRKDKAIATHKAEIVELEAEIAKQTADIDRARDALRETEEAHEVTKKDRNEYERQLKNLSKTTKEEVKKLKSEHLAELTERQQQYDDLRNHDSRHHKTGVTAAVTEVSI
jgi:chromosome segregation ATPase